MEESDGGSEIDLKIEVADDESSSHSDVDFVPAPPMPEPRHRNYRTEPTETVIPTVTVTQESGRDGTVWVENGDESAAFPEYSHRESRPLTSHNKTNCECTLCLCDKQMLQHIGDYTVAHAHKKRKQYVGHVYGRTQSIYCTLVCLWGIRQKEHGCGIILV